MHLKIIVDMADSMKVSPSKSLPIDRLLLALGLILSFSAGCNLIDGRSKTARNILIVSIDTLRADHVGAYGDVGANTPTIDRLASEGVRFDAAFSPAPLTLPSHSTLMTGSDPDRHGVRHNGIHRLGPEAITLGERFREAGFATAAVVGSLVIAAHSGLDQGFQSYEDDIADAGDHATAERSASRVNEAAVRFLDGTTEPFFLFVHYYDPHRPYASPRHFAEQARSAYDAEISYTDSMLGELIAHLDAKGRLEETLIVITSDHGESLGEHDELTHGHSIYDATQRIPLVLRGPGVPEGRSIAEIVRTSDIAPTLLARFGLAPLEDIDGSDLEPLWMSGASPVHVAYLESMATRYDHGWNDLRGMRSREYLYVQGQRPQLYDVMTDAGQRTNLLDTNADAHQERVARFDHHLALRQARSVTADQQDLDSIEIAQLRALGYAISDSPQKAIGLDAMRGRQSLSLYHAGDALYQSGHPREAAERFEEMLEISSESGEAWISLGAARLRTGELDRARIATRNGIARMPNRGSARLQMGVIEMAAGRPAEAEASFRQAMNLNPEAPGPRGRLLRALVRQGKLEEALSVDREIGELGWTSETWLRRIADFWEAEGQTATALIAYQRVLARAPDSERDHMHLAIALIRSGRLDEARTHLALSGDVARQPRARKALATSYLVSGFTEEARLLEAEASVGS